MERLRKFVRWTDRIFDHARARSLLRFLWKRYLDDRLFEAAGSLSYTTVFALVPLSIVVLGVLSAFPMFQEWQQGLIDFVFTNFVPSAASRVEEYLLEFSSNVGAMTTVGMVVLVITVLVTLRGVEQAFNRIWRVKAARAQLSRFLVYWTVLTLGALLAAAAIALFAQFLALSIFSTSPGRWLQQTILQTMPFIIELLVITALYKVVPHRSVRWKHAFYGALLAAVLLEVAKRLIALYLGNVETYQKIYGQVAFIPVFLLWIYLCWVSILLGASLAASFSDFRYQPRALRLPSGMEFYGVLRLLGRFAEARQEGRGLDQARIHALEPILSGPLLQRVLSQLERIRVLTRTEAGAWVLARDLDDVTMAELYEACDLRIGIDEASLPCAEDRLGGIAAAALDEVRGPLRQRLQRPVGQLFSTRGET